MLETLVSLLMSLNVLDLIGQLMYSGLDVEGGWCPFEIIFLNDAKQ